MAKPLPSLTEHVSPTVLGAYRIVKDLERDCLQGDQPEENNQQLINARILGYLLLYGPSDEARVNVAKEIASCEDENKSVVALGQFYYDHFIRPFKRAKSRTSAPSSHVSRPSFDRRQVIIREMLVEAPQSHAQAKNKALLRDDFRCPVSGYYDLSAQIPESLEALQGETHCCHIFSESTNANITNLKDSRKEHYAASVWAVMERMGYKTILEELNGPKIHRLENILTLATDIHSKFDRLLIWFEPMDDANTYRVRSARLNYLTFPNTIVTFSTPDPIKLPLPSREYLAIHAACATVANLSGAREHIDKIMRDMEDIQVLSSDGASADALKFALKPFANQVLVY